MWRLVLRGMLAHKLRVALTALSIILGVTFVTGTLVLTDTLRNTFTSLFTKVYANVDLQVRGLAAFSEGQDGGTTRKPISDSLLSQIRATPGVAAADGTAAGYAQFIDKHGKALDTGGAPALGYSYNTSARLSSLNLVAGHAPHGMGEVVIDRGTAKKCHFHIGDHLRILLVGPTRAFKVVGIVSFGSADNLAGATIAAFDLHTAQILFNEVGQLNSVEVLAKAGTSIDQLRHSIAAQLPKGVQVVTGQQVADEQSGAINTALGFFATALLVFAAISLFVGAFTIFNTFSITVGQRTRELALLRVIGASRRQVFRSVLAEAFVLGLLSSLIGLALGVLTAMGLEALLSAFGVTLPKGDLVFQGRTVFAAIAVGLGVTMVSAVSPARRAVRIPPIAALATYQSQTVESSRRRVILGLLVAMLGMSALGIGLSAPAIQLVGLGALAIFSAAGMLAPLVARPVSSAVGRPLARLLGVAGKLGRENSMRSPRRTAQTASALMVGLALVSTMAVFGASLSQSATQSITDAISADYIVMAQSSGGPPTGFSAAAIDSASKIRGVSAASPLYSGRMLVNGSPKSVTSVAPRDLKSTVVVRLEAGQGAKALAADEILVSHTVANQDRLKVGSELSLLFAQTGRTKLRVGGIFKPNALLGSYVLSTAYFTQHFAPNTLPAVMLISTTQPSSPAMTARLRAGLAPYPNLEIKTRAAFEDAQRAQVNQLLGLIYALLMLAIVIALIGIVNTLMLSVFERTREIGLLRAVGMKRRQVRTMVRAEAVILSVFGAIIGIVIGSGLGVALSRALKDQGLTEIVLPWSNLATFFVLAALLGLGAATWPARRAAKLNILQAISTE